MNQDWRFTAKSITKYNPVFRDDKGHYKQEEWVGFFQLGETINGESLTFSIYSETENKYITAAKLFFQFHDCTYIKIKNVEKKNFSDYNRDDKGHLLKVYSLIDEGLLLSINDLDIVVKLILRDLVWAELVCDQEESAAVRFGYDFYMYFNSSKNLDGLFEEVTELGLFVW